MASRSITGHSYEQFLRCPHRLWLRFNGDREPALVDPMARVKEEGKTLESAIYEQQFPGAIRISDDLQWDDAVHETLKAMRAGYSVILQAYLQLDERRGIADVLELVESAPGLPLGHLYKVGDVKRAEEPNTGHILQLVFYARILEKLQGHYLKDAFLISGSGLRHEFDLSDFDDLFGRLDSRLLQLRSDVSAPGPFLGASCWSCSWRQRCTDDMVQNQDLSLLPGLTRTRVELLRQAGIRSLDGVRGPAPRIPWLRISEWNRLVAAAEKLRDGIPPLRSNVPPADIALATPVFLSVGETETIWWKDDKGALVGGPADVSTMERLPAGRAILAFGSAQVASLAKTSLPDRPVMDLGGVVRAYFHLPFWTDTLGELVALSNGGRANTGVEQESTSPMERLEDLAQVRDWLARAS